MNHKLLFAAFALALGSAASAAVAAPAGDLSGVRVADGSKLLHAVHYDGRRSGRHWWHRNRWDGDNHHRRHKWWRHRRHHRDHDRWSWGRDRDDRRGYRHR